MDRMKMGYPSLNQLLLQSVWLSSRKFGNPILLSIRPLQEWVSPIEKLGIYVKLRAER
ncbi:MAG: hypothetical protein ACXU9W_14140 [Thermodesulfobacteriota bacterium]